MSAFIKAVSPAGELMGTSSPDSMNHFLIAGISAASFMAALILPTMASEVPGGANRALQATASNPLDTVSLKVGTSGSTLERRRLVMAIARILFSRIKGTAVDAP